MLVFVDESGCTGMKFGEGSSEKLVVSAVVFDDFTVANQCDDEISRFRFRLGWPNDAEFHFTELSHRLRHRFLEIVNDFDFTYHFFALDKTRVTGEGFRYPDTCYKFPTKLLFQNMRPYLKDAIVKFDQRGDRTFRHQLRNYLMRHVNGQDSPPFIKKIKEEPSHSNNLIQLADVVCGAIARSVGSARSKKHDFRQQIQAKERTAQVWPLPTTLLRPSRHRVRNPQ